MTDGNARNACTVCGEPCHLTHWGPVGSGGVCRYPDDPNQDDQGQHVTWDQPGSDPLSDIDAMLRRWWRA